MRCPTCNQEHDIPARVWQSVGNYGDAEPVPVPIALCFEAMARRIEALEAAIGTSIGTGSN